MTDEITEPVEEIPAAEAEPATATPEEPTTQVPEGEQGAEATPDADDTAAEQGNEGKRRAKKRIRQLSRKARTLEQENEALKERLDSIESRLPQPEEPSRPVEDDFETRAEYEDALFEWRDNKPQKQETPAKQEFTEEQQAIVEDFESKLEKAGVDDDMIDDILWEDWSTAQIAEFCRFSDKGAEVAVHLFNNRDAVDRIRQMSPIMALRELEKVESQVEASKPTAQVPPPPADTTKPGGSTPVLNEDKMSPDQWLAEKRAGRV